MARYLLGIDLGTSSVRSGIFHEEGKRLAVASRTYPINTPEPGRAEQDPELWWRCTCETIIEALTTAQLKGSDITGISFSAQMHGAVLLDSEGSPAVPAIIWADARSSGECSELEELLGEVRVGKILLNRIFPGTQAATLFWIKKNNQELWKRIRRVLLPKDYLRYRMCGLFNTEPSDASATLLFDVNLREWSSEILDMLGIPLEVMPYVVNSDQCIGETEGIEEMCGIPDGVPVVMGGADQTCAALGNGILDEGTMLVTIGTGGQIFAPVAAPKLSPGLSLNTFCHLPESRWYTMGATLSGGLCLRWFRNTFYPGVDFEELTGEAVKVTPGSDDLLFLPYLAGRRTPELNPSAAGVFAGIGLHHTRGHFVRAIMEGVAFELKENLMVMTEMGITPGTVILSGGAAKSPIWMQILSDVFNRTLSVSAQDEQACFGAALAAGVGTGVYGDWWKAAELVPVPHSRVSPDSRNTELYEKAFEEYRKISLP